MVDNGLIRSNAYSLWLNDLDANTGSILFGGVNTAKYQGQLQTLPILREADVYYEFVIALTGISIGEAGRQSAINLGGTSAVVLLDSGSSLTYLPNSLARIIFDQVGAQYFPEQEAAYVPCALQNNQSTIDFTFSSPTISVPMNELVIDPGTNSDGSQVTFNDGTPACLFGIAPAGQGSSVMGDTFLRSAYVVYDLENNEISLAQTNFNSTEDNVLEIGTGTNSIPDATGVVNPVTTGTGPTGGARLASPSLPGGPSQTGAGATNTDSTAGAVRTSLCVGVLAGVAVLGFAFVL